MTRHMFYGGNTPDGFYHNFDDILFLDEAQTIIKLKGSSGSGKSTLMRKIASAFEEKGADVDYIHCTNNISDLDGICIRAYGISLIDSTAPHTLDPAVPVAIDEIFNLAEFISRDRILPHAKELLTLTNEKKAYFEKAYRYLNAAYQIYQNNRSIRKRAVDRYALNGLIADEQRAYATYPLVKKAGRNRRMFATAITPQGYASYIDTLLDGYEIIALRGEDGTGTDELLCQLLKTLGSRGFDTESYYCGIDRNKIEHFFIPSLKIAYVTQSSFHTLHAAQTRTLNFDVLCDEKKIEKHADEIAYNTKIFHELAEKAMRMMADQKVVHDAIEAIYTASMDYEKVDRAGDVLLDRLIALPIRT